jgi:hypothetical protein
MISGSGSGVGFDFFLVCRSRPGALGDGYQAMVSTSGLIKGGLVDQRRQFRRFSRRAIYSMFLVSVLCCAPLLGVPAVAAQGNVSSLRPAAKV